MGEQSEHPSPCLQKLTAQTYSWSGNGRFRALELTVRFVCSSGCCAGSARLTTGGRHFVSPSQTPPDTVAGSRPAEHSASGKLAGQPGRSAWGLRGEREGERVWAAPLPGHAPWPPICHMRHRAAELLGGMNKMLEHRPVEALDESWLFYVPGEEGTRQTRAGSGVSVFLSCLGQV